MPPYGCNTDEHSSQNPDNAIAKKSAAVTLRQQRFLRLFYWNFFGSFFVKKEQKKNKNRQIFRIRSAAGSAAAVGRILAATR